MDNEDKSSSESSSDLSQEYDSEYDDSFDSGIIYDEGFDPGNIYDEFTDPYNNFNPLKLCKLKNPLNSVILRINVLPTSDLKMYVPIDEEECVDMLLDHKIKREDLFIYEQSTENEETENRYLSLCHCNKKEPVLALPLNIKMAKLKNARKEVENYRLVGPGGPCLKKIYCEPESKQKLSTTDCTLSLHEGTDNNLKSLQCFSEDSTMKAVDAPFIRACLANRNSCDRKPISLYSIKPTYEMKLSNVPRSLRIANAELFGQALRNQNLCASSDSDEPIASEFQEHFNEQLEHPTLSIDFIQNLLWFEDPDGDLEQRSRFSQDAEDKFTRPSTFSQISKAELGRPSEAPNSNAAQGKLSTQSRLPQNAILNELRQSSKDVQNDSDLKRVSETMRNKGISRFATGAEDELTRQSKFNQPIYPRYSEYTQRGEIARPSRISRAAQDQNLTRPSRFSKSPNAEFGRTSEFPRAAHNDYHNPSQVLTRPSRFSQAPNDEFGRSRMSRYSPELSRASRFVQASQDNLPTQVLNDGLTRPSSRFSKAPNAEYGRNRMSKFSPSTEFSRASRFLQTSQANLPTQSSTTQVLNDGLTRPSSRFSQAPKLSRASRFAQPPQDNLSSQTLNDRLTRPSSRFSQAPKLSRASIFSQAPNAERRGSAISRDKRKSRLSSLETFLIPKRLSSLHNLLEDRKVQVTPQHVLLTRALLPEYLCDINDQIIYLTPAKILQLLNDLKMLLQNNECINESGQFILEAIAYPYKDEKVWMKQEMPPKIKKLIKRLIKNKPLKTADLVLGKYLVGNHIFSGKVSESMVREELEKFSKALTSCAPFSRHHYNMALTLGIIPSLLDECSKRKDEKEIKNKRKTSSVNLLIERKSSTALSNVDLRKFSGLRRTLSHNNKINTKLNTNNTDVFTTEEKSSISSILSSIGGKFSDVHRTFAGELSTINKPSIVGLPLTNSTGKLTKACNFTRVKSSSNDYVNTSADTKNKPLSDEINDENKAKVLYVNRFAALDIPRPRTIEQYDYFKWLDDQSNKILNFKQSNQIPNRFAITQKSFKEITDPYRLKTKVYMTFLKHLSIHCNNQDLLDNV